MSNAVGIVGTDGFTPTYQPDARWQTWGLHEIYRGMDGLNKVVPKVNDYVVEVGTGNTFVVTSLDPVTSIPTLSPLARQNETTVNEIVSTATDNFRLYYDKSVSPAILSVDRFVRIHAPDASVARIYRGNLVDDTNIISQRYNNSGEFVGNDINLDLVAFNSHDNYGIKSVRTCNTKVELTDGEPAVLAVFDSNGKLLHRCNLVCEETTFVAQAYAEQKVIVNIFLKSAFISDTSSDEISYPVNLPTSSFSPIGVVVFNDGSTIEYPVDGDKFTLFGLDETVSSIIGHQIPLVLRYRMSPNESGLATVNGQGGEHFITRSYVLVVSSPNTSYNAKLYVYPEWVDPITGYRLRSYLMNLDRNIMFDVTNKAGLSMTSAAFDPQGYGITQRLTFSVDLSNVSSMFNPFLHVQTVDITLRAPGNDDSATNMWEVGSQVPTPTPYYGTGLRAVVDAITGTRINIDNGFATLTEFLNNTYKRTNPLINPQTEAGPLTPTHIELHHGNERIIIDINNYRDVIVFNHQVPRLSNIELTFMRYTTSGYLKLSQAVMMVR